MNSEYSLEEHNGDGRNELKRKIAKIYGYLILSPDASSPVFQYTLYVVSRDLRVFVIPS